MSGRVTWYDDRIRRLTTTVPERAHDEASALAAAAAAKKIDSEYTGALARDVSRPRKVAPGRSHVGSGLEYAAIENFGGTIRAKGGGRMLIRGKRGRSSFGAPIVASATQVVHVGKHYLEEALKVFPDLYIAAIKRGLRR